MVIRQLFRPERDPTRHLNEVVNAEAGLDARSEIEEYVFTEHTVEYLRTLIDGILGTSQGVIPDCLCGWIAGFFGSGKSHFLKLAGALLSNEGVEIGPGETRPALEYAVQRHRLALPWERLAREFKVKAVTVNLAMAHGGSAAAQRAPLFYRLASEINRAWKYSAVPHVAAIEREIERARKWKAFVDAVREETGKGGELDSGGRPLEWTSPDIRDLRSDAHRLLEIVLPKILPKYRNAREVLRDREGEQPGPEAVVGLAVDFARDLHADLGRVVLCVDEVALYLKGASAGFDADRVREVQGLAEAVKTRGQGRVFLLATAQLRVDTIDVAFADVANHVIFLRDRFLRGGRLELEERDIDTVVRERWLRKERAAPDHAVLDRLVRDHGGLLARATRLRDENIVRDADQLTDTAAVLAYYPCLPHHVRLLQLILEALRGEQQIDQTAAQNRALLSAVRSLFVPRNGANLAEAEIGTLVTFDRVYDVIRDVVRRADAPTDRWIVETIDDKLAPCGDLQVSSAAKVIFLLQRLNRPGQRRILVSAENVAALLYPRLGAPYEPHLAAVREACAKLHTGHFVGEEPDAGYRFYRPEEQSFQESVARQPVSEPKLRELLTGLLDAELERLGTTSLTVAGGHKLQVRQRPHVGHFDAPDPHARPEGLELHVLHPAAAPGPQQVAVWAAQYAGAPHVALWVLNAPPELDDLARRAIRLEAAIEEHARRHGADSASLLTGERERLGRLRDQALPEQVRSALARGVVIHRGVDTALDAGSRKPAEVFRDTMREAVAQVFPQLEDGCVAINETELRRTLSWRPPQPPPEFFGALRLFDADGHPLVDRPFLAEIILGLKGRPEHDRTGTAVLAHFTAAPYGWPERAVKAGLAALLRGRRIVVRPREGGPIPSEADPRAESWLTSTQQFNRSVIELSDFAVTAAERELLTRLFADVFDAAGRDTLEKLEQAARERLPECLARAREAHADLRGRQLPGAELVGSLVQVLEAALDTDQAAGRLKILAARAQAAAAAGDPVTALGRPARLVETVTRLRAAGTLDALAAIRARAAGLYPAWHGPEATALRSEIRMLSEQATSLELLDQADIARERDTSIFLAYGRAYHARHAERHARAEAALRRLEAHEGWPGAGGAVQDRLRAGLLALDCPGAGTFAASSVDGRCVACRAGFADLQAHIELLEAREQRGLAELDALLAPPPPPEPGDEPVSLTVDVASPDDLPELHRRIDEVGKEALTRPRRVRVIFETPR